MLEKTRLTNQEKVIFNLCGIPSEVCFDSFPICILHDGEQYLHTGYLISRSLWKEMSESPIVDTPRLLVRQVNVSAIRIRDTILIYGDRFE